MEVSVERYVEQVRDGEEYKGYIKIGKTRIDYELQFTVPIPRLDDMELPSDPEGIRRVFLITVKKADAVIELTYEEYGFFFQMLTQLAVEFYNDPQTRDSNKGIVGMALRREGPLVDVLGAHASIGITSTGSYNFQPELCAMLSAPKFGCVLAAN